MRELILGVAAGSLLATACVAPAVADGVSILRPATDEWRFAVTPYLFLPVTSTGTATVDGRSADVDLDLSDILNNLDFAASARFEAWKGDVGLMADFYYVNLNDDSTVDLSGPANSTVGVDIKLKQGWFALLAAHRLLDGKIRMGGGARRYALEGGIGFRYNVLEQKIKADLNVDIGPGRGFQRTLGGTKQWVEPVLSLRGALEVADEWALAARADVGGFGAGGDNVQWLVVAGVDYQPWDVASIKLGWQAYGIDYSTDGGDFAYDVFQTGPFLGATFNF